LDEERVNKEVEELSPEDELLLDVQEAHEASLRALNALYSRSGPKRGYWYRVALGRAQSTLMTLLQQELQRKTQRGIDRES
jgi:hypothetical protein